MAIGERLKNAVKSKKLKLTEFAEQSKIPYATLQKYTANKMVPGGELVIKICTELGISIDWLLTGQGEMYRTKTEATKETTKGITKWLSTWWDGANEEDKHWLNGQMKRCFPEYAEWCEQEEKKDKKD
jgi:transcriptional regulator with XRE-family HTH domain